MTLKRKKRRRKNVRNFHATKGEEGAAKPDEAKKSEDLGKMELDEAGSLAKVK